MKQEKQSTSDRILDASLMLFNQHGYQNVPAMKIAQHLGISHGHLCYHFKSKADIVLSVFPLLEQAVRAARPPGGATDARDAVLHQVDFWRALWRYRFFFNALTQLLSRDEALRKRYLVLQESVVQMMQALFDVLVVQGDMKSVDLPTTTRTLARCCWMTGLSWLRFEQIDNPSPLIARDAAVYDAIMLNFGMVQAYFTKRFSADVLRELGTALNVPKTKKKSLAPKNLPGANGAAPRATRVSSRRAPRRTVNG